MAMEDGWASSEDWENYLHGLESEANDSESEPLPRIPILAQRTMMLVVPLEVHWYMPDGSEAIGTQLTLVGIN